MCRTENRVIDPLISVIVSVYNVESYIEKCIESIINQTYKNLEIILIDDGSTDVSGKICDEWSQKDKRIQVYHNSNQGLVHVRKEGIIRSHGEYIAHVDSDDWIEPDMYSEMLEAAIKSDADIVTSGLIRDYENHSVIENEGFKEGVYKGKCLEEEYWPNVVETDRFFKTNVNMHITNKLFKKDFIARHHKALSENIRIGEDAAIIYPAVFDATCITVMGKNFYHYTIRNNSIMNITKKNDISSDNIEKRFISIINEKKDRIPEIEKQLSAVILYTRLFSNPDLVFRECKNRLYPFHNLRRGDRVILYGAGRFGKRVFSYLKKIKYCEIVAWCDKTPSAMTITLDDALQHNFDKIIISILSADIGDEIQEMLKNRRVEEHKICRVRIT